MRERLQARHVFGAFVLVDSRARGKLVDSRLDAELFLGDAGAQPGLLQALRNNRDPAHRCPIFFVGVRLLALWLTRY